MNGVANVLSQTLNSPRWRAIAATACRSTSFSKGFVGVSTHTMRVLGLIAASRFAGFVRSTNDTSCAADRLRTCSRIR